MRRMIHLAKILIVLTAAVYLQPLSAARPDTAPKVAVVLSGGGVRGLAHIGVLKVLDEVGMPIDYIVGTSMGGIVGGLYASGYSAREIEALAREINWQTLFTDTAPRRLWSYRRRDRVKNYILGLEFSRDGFVVSQGLTSGQKIYNLLTLLTRRVSHIRDFDQLPVPFRAVAVDIITGREIILKQGSLTDAMRASMSIPGIFTPVRIDDQLLVDGGVLNNLPVDVARGMGADLVIAVDITSPLMDRKALNNPATILYQMIAVQMKQSSNAQRKFADMVITPDLKGYTMAQFDQAIKMIPLGEQAARRRINRLKKLAGKTRPGKKNRRTRSHDKAAGETVQLDRIIVTGDYVGDEEALLRKCSDQTGKAFQPGFWKKIITELYSSGYYETVTFALEPGPENGKTLVLRFKERSRGPLQFNIGFHYTSRFSEPEENRMILLANMTIKELTTPGSLWSTSVQTINATRIETTYLQPLFATVFIEPLIYYEDDYQTLYRDGRPFAQYDIKDVSGFFRLGTFLSNIGMLFIGYELRYSDVSPTSNFGQQLDAYYDFATSLRCRLNVDTLDRYPFSREGGTTTIDYLLSSPYLGGDITAYKLAFDLRRYVSAGSDHTWALRIQGGTAFLSDLHLVDRFTLGGRYSFAGYRTNELTGAHFAALSLTYRFRFFKLPPSVGSGIYGIIRANAGNTWENYRDISARLSLRYGGSIGVGVDTIMGPIYFDVAAGDNGRGMIYLNIGHRIK